MSDFLNNLGKIGMVMQAGGQSLAGRDGMNVVRTFQEEQAAEERKSAIAGLMANMGIAGPKRAFLESLPWETQASYIMNQWQQEEQARRAAAGAGASAAREAAARKAQMDQWQALMGGGQPQASSPYSTGVSADFVAPSARLSFGQPAPVAPQIGPLQMPNDASGVGAQMLRNGDPTAVASMNMPPRAPLMQPQEAPAAGLSFGSAATPAPAAAARPAGPYEMYRRALEQAYMAPPGTFEPGVIQALEERMKFFAPPEAPTTDDIKEYNLAVSQGETRPFTEWMRDMRGAGATRVDVSTGENQPQVGTIPPGYAVVEDPNSPAGYRMVPIPGGPEDTSAKTETRQGLAATSGDVVLAAAARARAANKDRIATGAAGALAAFNPASNNAEVYRQVDVLRSMAAAENLNAMRQASPTGGALGNASDADINLLKQKAGALEPASPNFERDLEDYERTLLEVIHGREAGRKIYEETRPVRTVPQGEGSRRSANPNNRSGDAATGGMKAPPKEAIDLLRATPTPEYRAFFDQVFGEGAAAEILGQ